MNGRRRCHKLLNNPRAKTPCWVKTVPKTTILCSVTSDSAELTTHKFDRKVADYNVSF